MSGPYTCDKCGVEYGKHTTHECMSAGEAAEEISALRGRVDDLEDEVAAIKAFLGLP